MVPKPSHPVLFFAFANDRENYLAGLPAEADKLNKILERLVTEGGVQIVMRYRATAKDILDVFQSDLFRDRVAIFHYGGHANGYSLLLEGAAGQSKAADAGGLAAFLGQQRGLQLVFLNGCSTAKQTRGLLDTGVPVVITTNQAIDDNVAVDFSASFYMELATHETIQKAFDTAVSAVQFSHGTDPRHLYVVNPPPSIEPPDLTTSPWALHPNPQMADALEWCLPEISPTDETPSGRVDFYFTQAPLVTNYVERPELLVKLKQALFSIGKVSATDETPKESLALQGMGGSGKTVMARALCDDQEVQAVFSGGILWGTLGQEQSRVSETFREWIRVFGESVAQDERDLRKLRYHLNKTIGERKLLLIVDDVWSLDDARSFREIHPNVTLLFTARDAFIVERVDAEVIRIPPMELAEATELLDEWVGNRSILTEEMKAFVVERLSCLPLAIKLAGSQRSLHRNPAKWLETFDAANLKEGRGTAIHDSLVRTFDLSLHDLDERKRRLYSTLAIFRKDEPITERTITTLWNATAAIGEDEAVEILEELTDHALLDSESQKNDERTYHVHGLLRDLMVSELSPKDTAQTHERLLAHYRKNQSGKEWFTAENDGYLYGHLVYHLKELALFKPEIEQDLHNLFADQQWLQARLEQDDFSYRGYGEDLLAAWDVVHQHARDDSMAGQIPTTISDCVRYALISSSVNSLVSNYVPGLVVAAVNFDLWSEARAISVLESMTEGKDRLALVVGLLRVENIIQKSDIAQIGLKAACTLEPFDSAEYEEILIEISPHMRGAALEEVLVDILLMKDVQVRAEVLTQISPHLTIKQIERVREFLNQKEHEHYQAYGLGGLAILLKTPTKETVLKDALKIALTVEDDFTRCFTLRVLAAQLWGKQKEQALEKALEAGFAIQDSSDQADALSSLASQLVDEQRERALERALEAACAIESEFHRASTLGNIAVELSEVQLETALESALTIESEPYRALAVGGLAAQLSGTQLEKALEGGLALESESSIASVLSSLAAQLSEKQIETALEMVLFIRSEPSRASVLGSLSAYLSEIQLEKALEVALAIESDYFRASALGSLAAHSSSKLKECVLEKALNAALAIEAEYLKALALGALAVQLSRAQLDKTLEAALAIQDELSKASVLDALAAQLSRTQIEKALVAALAIQDEHFRASTFVGLAAQHSGKQKENTLEIALETVPTIQDGYSKASVLSSLAAQLSGERKEHTLDKALQTTLIIQDELSRLSSLVSLAAQLSGEQKEDVLEMALRAALAIQRAPARASALVALADQLSDVQKEIVLDKAVDAALAIQDELHKAAVLGDLVAHLSSSQLDKISDVAHNIKSESAKATVLISLAAQLLDEQKERTLEMAQEAIHAIQDASAKASVLVSFAAQLSGRRKERTLKLAQETTQAIQDVSAKAPVLVSLAAQLSGKQKEYALEMALEIALAIQDESSRQQILNPIYRELTERSLSISFVRRMVVQQLQALGYYNKRRELLQFLQHGFLFTEPFFPVGTSGQIVQHVDEICNEWRWL